MNGKDVGCSVWPSGEGLGVRDNFCGGREKAQEAGWLWRNLNLSHVVRMFLESCVEETEEVIHFADRYPFNDEQWQEEN